MSAFEPKVIGVTWVGVDELTPTMNRISGGLTNMGRQNTQITSGMSKQYSLLDTQMRILRRSAEYMVAGFGIYKVMQAFQTYKQFRSELGALNANLMVGTDQLNQFGKAAIDISNRTAVPVNQVVESMQNLAASFPDINIKAKQYLFPVMAEIEAKASQILGAGVAPQTFGSTVLQQARSFYGAQAVTRSVQRNPTGNNLLEKTASQVLQTYFQVPGTSGEALINYLPTLLMGAKASGFTIPQALSMFTVAQRVGGRPAQMMQYLRQMMLRLHKPPTGAAQYFQQAGIGTEQFSSYSGWQILMALLKHAVSLPGGATPAELKKMMASGNFQGLNLTGQAGQFLRQALGGRIQSEVAVSALATGYADLNREVKKLTNNTYDLNNGFNKWLTQNQLQKASNQLSNFSLSAINTLTPAINLGAGALIKVSGIGTTLVNELQRGGGFLSHITGGLSTPVMEGAGAFGIARALGLGAPIGKILARKGLTGLAKVFMTKGALEKFAGVEGESAAATAAGGLIGSAIRGPIDVQALGSALAGVANGTPTAPFWVVIHPMSMMTVPQLFGNKNSPSFTKMMENMAKQTGEKVAAPVIATAEAVAKKTTGRTITGRILGRTASRLAGKSIRFGSIFDEGLGSGIGGTLAGGIAGGAATGVAASLIWPDVAGTPQRRGYVTIGDYTRRITASSLLAKYLQAAHGNIPRGILTLLTSYASGRISEAQVGKGITNYFATNLGALNGHMSKREAGAFYKYVSPLYNLGAERQFVSRATSSEGYFMGQADLVIEIQPTQEFKNFVKPQKIRARVPTRFIPGHAAPAPTSRNRTTTRNNG